MRPPIVSRKHIVQHTQFTVASAAVASFTDVVGAAVQDVNTASEIIEGSIVKAIYVELWLISDTLTNPAATYVLIFEKGQSESADPSFADMTTLDAYQNKKNVLFVSQGLLAEEGGNPTPVHRGWIKIPKGKQRFGLKDTFKIHIAAIGTEGIDGCGFSIYKSYT